MPGKGACNQAGVSSQSRGHAAAPAGGSLQSCMCSAAGPRDAQRLRSYHGRAPGLPEFKGGLSWGAGAKNRHRHRHRHPKGVPSLVLLTSKMKENCKSCQVCLKVARDGSSPRCSRIRKRSSRWYTSSSCGRSFLTPCRRCHSRSCCFFTLVCCAAGMAAAGSPAAALAAGSLGAPARYPGAPPRTPTT